MHLSVILGVLVLLRAGNYWLERYELATKNSTLITGLTYADAHAVLPAKAILAAASVICAGAVLRDDLDRVVATARRRGRAAAGRAPS